MSGRRDRFLGVMGEEAGVAPPYGTVLGRLLCVSWLPMMFVLGEWAVATLGVWGSSRVGVTSMIVGESVGDGWGSGCRFPLGLWAMEFCCSVVRLSQNA